MCILIYLCERSMAMISWAYLNKEQTQDIPSRFGETALRRLLSPALFLQPSGFWPA